MLIEFTFDNHKDLGKDLFFLKQSFNPVTCHPEEFAGRLSAILMNYPFDLEESLMFTSGRVSTDDDFIWRVRDILFDNGTNDVDWYRTINGMILSFYIKCYFKRLINTFYALGDIQENSSEYNNCCPYCRCQQDNDQICPDCWHQVNQMPAIPSKQEQEKHISELGLKLCEECLIPIKPDESCDHTK
jgi:hypothetical protein